MGSGKGIFGKMTSDRQIDKIMKDIFPNEYLGIFDPKKIPRLKNNKIAIVFEGPNDRGHWRAVYRHGGKLYEYDSFHRDRQGKRYKDDTSGPKQKPTETNCGQRTVAHLIKVFRFNKTK